MSASDKKQQRKAELVEGLTQKQRKEQAEAQAAKRKKTTYVAIGVICAVAAVALLIWSNLDNWTSGSHKNDVAATVGGVDYTVTDLQYYYTNARSNEGYMYQVYSQMGMTAPFNPYLDDGAQWQDEANGVTYADYFREQALKNLQEDAALCAAAQAEGYTLSDEGKANIDTQLSQIDVTCAQYGWTRNIYFEQVFGIKEKDFIRNLTNELLADEYSKRHEDGITYDDAALQAYYEEHPETLDSYDYRSFLINGAAPDPVDENGDPMKDADGNTITATDEEKAAAMAAAKEAADEAVAQIEAAEDREAAFIAAAPEYVSESERTAYASPEQSLNKAVMGNTLSRNSSVLFPWLSDSARKTGDVTAIESTNGYQVVLFLDRYLDPDNSVNIRHILIKADVAEGETEPTQEAMDAAKAEAQSLMDQWQADSNRSAESFGALAEEYSDDPGSNTNGGEYTYVSKGQMFEGFDAWIFDENRQPGDVGLVENPQSGQQGWHVIYFEGTDAYWENTAIEAKKATDQSEWLSGLVEKTEAVAMDGMQYVGSANTAVPTSETEAPAESPEASPEA